MFHQHFHYQYSYQILRSLFFLQSSKLCNHHCIYTITSTTIPKLITVEVGVVEFQVVDAPEALEEFKYIS
jgi:hypothetical protein